MINKKFGLTLAAVSSLFSGAVMADPYLPSSIGNVQPMVVAGGSSIIVGAFGDAVSVIFTLTGENAQGASLAAVPADEASVASARGAQASEGVLPNGTYTFVDENGGEARVRVEDGELIPLH